MNEATWRARATAAVDLVGTPCFVMSEDDVRAAVKELDAIPCCVPRRHWLSLKSQPVKPLLRAWHRWGLGTEVVSEFELVAALAEQIPPESILVNGTAKHHWLPSYGARRLNVHFDSLGEIEALLPRAKALDWSIGVRLQVPIPDEDGRASSCDQFGMTGDEVLEALRMCHRVGVPVDGAHFHMRSNLRTVTGVRAALRHVRHICDRAMWEPSYIDIGGGLPVSGERPLDCQADPGEFDLPALGREMSGIPEMFPKVREVWQENGRFVTARAGVLVVTVVDRKKRNGVSYLICDGGRTNHARMAALESHDILVCPERDAAHVTTVVCGPTCAAIDRLGTWSLPETVAPGDRIVWLNAGAYHMPLETRFSFGLAPFVWLDGTCQPFVARRRESPEQWWGTWRN